MIVLYILLAILILEFLIFVHELGHYTAGKLLGFKILDFSLGFGPKLIKFRRGETSYSLRAIPVGGSCQFDGEDEEEKKPGDFNSHPVWKRLIVIFSGPLMNIITAFIIAVIMMLALPVSEYRQDPVTGEYLAQIVDITEGGAADLAGLRKGDIIIEVDGRKPVSEEGEEGSFNSVVSLIINAEPDFTMLIERDGKIKELLIEDAYDPEKGVNMIGISISATPTGRVYHLTVAESVPEAFNYLVRIVEMTAKGIVGMFENGIHQGDISGVVGTVAIMVDVASENLSNVIALAIIISLSLGMFNLIPFPALDGGRILFLLIEAVIGKRINRKVEAAVNMVGLLLLFGLMIVTMVTDVIGIIGR